MEEVILIKASHPESQGEFVRINDSDFDPEKHELWIENVTEMLPEMPPEKPKKRNAK